jgi:hypothetical protein
MWITDNSNCLPLKHYPAYFGLTQDYRELQSFELLLILFLEGSAKRYNNVRHPLCQKEARESVPMLLPGIELTVFPYPYEFRRFQLALPLHTQ